MKRTQNVPTESIALAFVAMQYNVKLADVPASPAYLVCHDHFDHGAMEVWPMSDKVAKTVPMIISAGWTIMVLMDVISLLTQNYHAGACGSCIRRKHLRRNTPW